jgi:diacylglycerol kinase family enzyme
MHDSSDGLGRRQKESAPGLGADERALVTGAGDRVMEGARRLRSGQALRRRSARELDPTDKPDAALILGGDGTMHRQLGGLALKPTGSIFARVRSKSGCAGMPCG